jgi:hypothetical protein
LQYFHEQLLNECNNSSAQKIALHQVLEHEIQSTLESLTEPHLIQAGLETMKKLLKEHNILVAAVV